MLLLHLTLQWFVLELMSATFRACSQITWTKLRSDLGQIWLWRPAPNRRRSSATSRILRLSRSQKWPEDERQDVLVICEQTLSKEVL